MKNRIAILGATGHIAKGLICNFIQSKGYKLFLFARSPQRVRDFLRDNALKRDISLAEFKGFPQEGYDIIINCIGIGTPHKLKDTAASIFSITEEYDTMVMDYLTKSTQSCYINLSSGAVYGSSFTDPVSDTSVYSLRVNDITPEQYYGIAKINSEAKHRSRGDLNIVDVRIFSYFSRFIDLHAGYFLTDLINSIKEKRDFLTTPCDFIRDYLHPHDLFALIKLIMENRPSNGAFDAYSAEPVSKFTLLDYFAKTYALNYIIDDNLSLACPTGTKEVYCSQSKRAAKLGYSPRFSSLETVMKESEFILGSIHE